MESKNEKLGAKEKELNNDKESLKLDALKYYKGKLPEGLSKKWEEEEKNHSEWIEENYIQKLKDESSKAP